MGTGQFDYGLIVVIGSCRYHLAIYLPTDEAYEAAFERAKQHGQFQISQRTLLLNAGARAHQSLASRVLNYLVGLLYFNEAFRNTAPEFGSSMTREEAMKYRQFRLKNMYADTASAGESPRDEKSNGADGTPDRELLLMLEHEVRAPSHRANPMLRAMHSKPTEGNPNP